MTGIKIDPQKLTMHVVDYADHPALEEIYEIYVKSFPNPDERASKEDFIYCLECNSDETGRDKRIASRWVYLKDEETGKIAGATWFIGMAGSETAGISGTIHNSYLFVTPEYRGNKIMRRLITEMETVGDACFREIDPKISPDAKVVTIVEQNSPTKMSVEEYKQDATLISPSKRRARFEDNGFNQVDIPYIQPALAEGLSDCKCLDLVVKARGVGKQQLPSSVLKEHLNRLFDFIFPEGTSLNNPNLVEMKESLDRENVNLIAAGRFEKLGKTLKPGMVEQFPDNYADRTVAELFPWISGQFDKDTARSTPKEALRA